MLKFTLTLTNDNSDYAAKQAKATLILNAVWNSDEFKQAVLNNSHEETTGALWWKKTVTVNSFTTTDMTNQQVYDALMKDQEIHINQDIVACSNSKVVGYEYDGDPTTYVCEGWDTYLDVAGVCDNASHELCHQKGFVHSSARDIESVPYKIGTIVQGLAQKLIQSQALQAGSPPAIQPVP